MNIIIEKVITYLVMASVISVFVAIFIDFTLYEDKDNVKKSKKSIVATGTMILYYLFYYIVLRLRLGTLKIESEILTITLLIIGTAMIIAGAVMNILGRLKLKNNWSNHIKIYDGHTLIQRGVYKIVRHPLYASIMLMLFGGSIVYRNYLSALLTAFVFIPFMYYRAKQEEELLSAEFEDYKIYKQKTGMFFPKIWR